jgi:hypothetical protein
MGSTVFAVSDFEGSFEELVHIDNVNIIEYIEEGYDGGLPSVKVMDDGEEDTWFYIDLVEID